MVCPNWWEIIRKYDFKETINKSEYCPHSLYTKDNKNDHRKIKYFCNYISANNVNFKTRLNLTQFTFNQYKFCVANRLVILSSFSTREKWKFLYCDFLRQAFFWNKACNDLASGPPTLRFSQIWDFSENLSFSHQTVPPNIDV